MIRANVRKPEHAMNSKDDLIRAKNENFMQVFAFMDVPTYFMRFRSLR